MLSTERILARLYPGPLKRKRRRRRGLGRAIGWLRTNAWQIGVGFGLVIAWVVGHLYFYNKLVDMEYNLQESWAQVEAQLQRRFFIQQSVTQVVLAYARHEQDLLERLTRLRTSTRNGKRAAARRPGTPAEVRRSQPGTQAPAAAAEATPSPAPAARDAATAATRREAAEQPANGAPGAKPPLRQLQRLGPDELNQVFPQIQFMAEQYPKLRLTENYQQFSKAIIETETKIAERIEDYNRKVNDYTTVLKQFPGNVFGAVCGFKPYPFFAPDKHTLVFRPVTLEG